MSGPAWTPEIEARFRALLDAGPWPGQRLVRAALAELDRRAERIAELESAATMACETPSENCECPGCCTAREFSAGTARIESALRDLGSEYTAPEGWEDQVREAVDLGVVGADGIVRPTVGQVGEEGPLKVDVARASDLERKILGAISEGAKSHAEIGAAVHPSNPRAAKRLLNILSTKLAGLRRVGWIREDRMELTEAGRAALRDLGSEYTAPEGWEDQVREAVEEDR